MNITPVKIGLSFCLQEERKRRAAGSTSRVKLSVLCTVANR